MEPIEEAVLSVYKEMIAAGQLEGEAPEGAAQQVAG